MDSYEVALARTKASVDEADPDGLLAFGAPPDEYAAPAAECARRLLHGEDPSLIVGDWTEWRGCRDRGWLVDRLQDLQEQLGR